MTKDEPDNTALTPAGLQFSLRAIFAFTAATALVFSIGRCLGEHPMMSLGNFFANLFSPVILLFYPLLLVAAICNLATVPVGILLIGIDLIMDTRCPRSLFLWFIGAIGVVMAAVGVRSFPPNAEETIAAHGFLFMSVGSVFAAAECWIKRSPKVGRAYTALAIFCTLGLLGMLVLVSRIARAA